ncbi:DNA gyrase inhibitor YacG [Stappia sp. F7233]|uniref:DNA gyrase inhibitor YacG n=1 Tax=Stappia albiluteola TaxID=2758565 RepID=A0A839AHI4_9HYPH|nr:DNA gyrase inhibitor YacG [Stappia albiluteola]MBA5778207.1 DNA gyrase inhibitor YacG [Stappia albiluteola]
MSDEAEKGEAGKTETAFRRARPCPVCSKLSAERFHPFCSKRCADVDLNRWLSGSYTVPVVEMEPEDFDELERELGKAVKHG